MFYFWAWAPRLPTRQAPFVLRVEGAGIGLEVMNSSAACRTYNVLLSEGRRIAVALIAVAE